MPQHHSDNPTNKKRASRPPSYATYNPDFEYASSCSERSDSDELYEPDLKHSDWKMASGDASSSSSKAKFEEAYSQDGKEVYPEDKKNIYPEDKKETVREYRPPTPVFEAYPTPPPPPPQVTFIRPRRFRSSCAFMGLLIVLALSLTLNFIWITVALNRSIGPGIPDFSHHQCDCQKSDTPAINFAPQIDLHPAQAAADGSTDTVTTVSTFTITVLSSLTTTQTTTSVTTSSTSQRPESTTVVIVTPSQSTVNSTTIITVSPSASPRSTVFSTTTIDGFSSGKTPTATSAAPSKTLSLQKGNIPDMGPLPDTPSASLPSTATKSETPAKTETIGEANGTNIPKGCVKKGSDAMGADICP